MSPQKTARRQPVPGHERYQLAAVARMTGLTPDLIRAWERRYAVVRPLRGPRGARLYSAADVERLQLLAAVVGSGRTIGDVARLDNDELAALVRAGAPRPFAPEAARRTLPQSDTPPPTILEEVLGAVQRYDRVAVERLLGDALIAAGAAALAETLLAPLLHEVGERWMRGTLSVAQEHFFSAILRDLVGGFVRNRRPMPGRPRVLLATPEGELHEFGLLLAALTLGDSGFDVLYLGASVPTGDLREVTAKAAVDVVGLSVVNAANRSRALRAIEVLAAKPTRASKVELWIGGRDATALSQAVKLPPETKIVPDLVSLRARAQELATRISR